MDPNAEKVRLWYEAHASEYDDSSAIQPNHLFQRFDSVAQSRLNKFKLWFLEEGGLVAVRDKKVLEFGCGHARMALQMRGYASYVGIDFVEAMVTKGRRRIVTAGLTEKARLVYADCLEYDGPKAAFDVVCAFGMFEYISDPTPMLRKMVYHLRPGGTLVLDAHSSSPLYDPVRNWRNRRSVKHGGIPKYLHRPDDLCVALTSVGLTLPRILMAEFPFLSGLYARMRIPGQFGH